MSDPEVLQNILTNKRWENQITAIEQDSDSDSEEEEILKELKMNILAYKKKEKKIVVRKSKKPVKVLKPGENKNDPHDLSGSFKEIDKVLYNKKWIRLPEVHRITKVREFINSFGLEDDDSKEMIELLTVQIKDKTLKNSQVLYIPEEARIMRIDGVTKFNKVLKEYEIEQESESESD